MKMNQHYNELKASYLFVDINHRVAAFQKAHPDRDVIRLGIGDVTRPLAKSVVKAMQDAVAEMGSASGFHGYGPEQGYDFLREAVQGYYAGRGVKLEADEIFISDGAKSDLANILGLFSEDNTVLVPDPVYPTYVESSISAAPTTPPARPTAASSSRSGWTTPKRTTPSSSTTRPMSALSRRKGWPAASLRWRARGTAPLRSAPSPRSPALPAPAAATPWCPTSWSGRG